MAQKGLECPWCMFIPTEDDTLRFKVIKTIQGKGKVIRAKECPKCGRDFLTVETSLTEPFFKKKFIEQSLNG